MKKEIRPLVRGFYDIQKLRPKHKEKSDMHRHNMANRYMIKRFIVDLYVEWRKLEGLPVSGEYAEEKLSISH